MRRITPLLLLASVVAAAPSGAAAAMAPVCERKSGDTLYRSPGLRVFQRVTESKRDPDAVVVTRDGGIALIGAKGAVIGLDKAGRRVLEATGASDLAVAGTTVYWTVAGQPKAAKLEGAPSGEITEPEA